MTFLKLSSYLVLVIVVFVSNYECRARRTFHFSRKSLMSEEYKNANTDDFEVRNKREETEEEDAGDTQTEEVDAEDGDTPTEEEDKDDGDTPNEDEDGDGDDDTQTEEPDKGEGPPSRENSKGTYQPRPRTGIMPGNFLTCIKNDGLCTAAWQCCSQNCGFKNRCIEPISYVELPTSKLIL